MMKAGYSRAAYFVLALLISLMAIKAAFAQSVPGVPDTLTVGSSTRHIEGTGGFSVPAAAGNVSALVINEVRITQFWQGYYGNVTGQIVLDDGSNSTMFAWELARPSGEIFAVNTSNAVQWANISCVNFTAPANYSGVVSNHKVNLSSLAAQFTMNRTLSLENLSKDAFNYTFNTTYQDSFQVGSVVIGDDEKDTENCHQLYTFVNDAYQTAVFKEVLLYDNLSALVFTTFLHDNQDGYQSGSNDLHDFQLMVAEDGSPGKEAASTYYFYVELE